MQYYINKYLFFVFVTIENTCSKLIFFLFLYWEIMDHPFPLGYNVTIHRIQCHPKGSLVILFPFVCTLKNQPLQQKWVEKFLKGWKVVSTSLFEVFQLLVLTYNLSWGSFIRCRGVGLTNRHLVTRLEALHSRNSPLVQYQLLFSFPFFIIICFCYISLFLFPGLCFYPEILVYLIESFHSDVFISDELWYLLKVLTSFFVSNNLL